MRRSDRPVTRAGARLALILAGSVGVAGCRAKEKIESKSVSRPPGVRVVQPATRPIVRKVGQPSFIESYERSAIYPKLTGYIEKWNVDIGDKVAKNDLLATLFVPELVEDFGTKKATVKLDQERIDLAQKLVEVADADVKSAEAAVAEAKAILGKYQSEVDRWGTEVKRLEGEVKRGVVDPQILLESTNQWRSATASRDAAQAGIAKADADLVARRAALAKSRVDVGVARADLAVAVSDMKRIEAWVGYISLRAPFDGVIVARNANTGDFVAPSAGDPTADSRAPYVAPGGSMAPIYVVDRTDVVRVFVDVPEADANHVRVGSKATVVARAFRDQPIHGSVTRTSWALNVKSRTLRAEVDLPNPGGRLLPGMYAYATVLIERPDAMAVPATALTYVGDRTYCWLLRDGKSYRTEVRTGVGDGDWVEALDLDTTPADENDDAWTPVNGRESVIIGDLSILTDGGPVEVITTTAPGQPETGAKSAGE